MKDLLKRKVYWGKIGQNIGWRIFKETGKEMTTMCNFSFKKKKFNEIEEAESQSLKMTF